MKFVKKAIALGVAMCLLAGCQSPAKPNDQEQSDSSAASSVSADSEGPKLTTEALEKMPLTGQGTWVDGEDGTKWYKNTGTFYDAFDTMIQFVAYTKDEKEFDRYFTLCRTEFERLHKLYDNYKEYEGVSNLMTLNKTAAQAPVAVEDDLFSMLAFSKENYAKTLGKVNIAMGATLTLWHDTREAAIAEQEEHEHDASHSDPMPRSACPQRQRWKRRPSIAISMISFWIRKRKPYTSKTRISNSMPALWPRATRQNALLKN